MRHAPKTRKLSYRKYYPAIRPINGCPENFRESIICVQNWKFVLLPITEIIGVPPKRQFLDTLYAPFSPKSLMGFCSNGPVNVLPKFEVRI